MQQLTTREEVKALPLQTIFEDAVGGQDTAFGHVDEDTFEFAKRRARTATQKLVDGEGQRFSGRVRVLTDPSTLTITYCQTGTAHPAAPEARRRVERKAAVVGTGVVIETRKVMGGGKAVDNRASHPSEYIMDDETLVKGEIIYGCQPGCAQSVGPAAAPGDDIRCAHCKRTNKTALKEFSAILMPPLDEDGQTVPPEPTIKALFEVEADRHIVKIRHGTGKMTRKEMREGDLGDAVTEAAEKARQIRSKRGRESLARRRGRK